MASWTTVSVFSPRKSIFSRPRSFRALPSYWERTWPSLSRESGTKFVEVFRADHDAGRVDAGAAHEAFQNERVVPDLARVELGLDGLL